MPPIEELSRAELVALVVAQAGTIEAQADAIGGLKRRVAELERRLSRNSGNSSMPPSTDDMVGKNRAARRAGKASGRKRGKQPGAPGSGLPWSDRPDERIAHYPDGTCPCGSALSQAADLGVEQSRQVHDVPPVSVHITQHDLHRVRCECGREHVAGGGAAVAAAPVSYGVNLQALVVYLLVFQHVPVHRCAQLIADVTGAAPSIGYVHSMLARGANAVAEVVAQIKAELILADVVGFDETTLRVGPAGAKRHVLSANTDTHTAFWLGGRDLASFHAFGVLDSFAGVAVHDRYTVYDHPDFAHLAGHQLCAAHLLRDLADAAEVYPDQHWPEQADRALRALISAWHGARDHGQRQVPDPLRRGLIRTFRDAVLVGLSHIPPTPGPNAKGLPARALLECLRDREADVLRFASDTRVWPTNNISERGLRPEKTQQKISGRLQSEQITRHRLTIRSYLSTAAKHRVNLMSALHDAMTGHPWSPPTSAPA